MMTLLKNRWERCLLITLGFFVLVFEILHTGIEGEGLSHYNHQVLSRMSSNVQANMTALSKDVPVGYHLLTQNLVHTDYVGTPNHPTIDGGLINTSDGVPINHDMLVENSAPVHTEINNAKAAEPQLPVPVSFRSGNTNTTAFQDDWANNRDVKRLLIEAAQDGKLNYVLRKSQQMHLPASVAVVPMVESHYQTNAVSNKGAAGAWQLMPTLAKDYGISNQDRFQFSTATDIALQHLKNLHQQFGNWDLAFAAYNAGAMRVQTALNKNPDAKNMNDLDLPEETKNYVYRMKQINQEIKELGNQ